MATVGWIAGVSVAPATMIHCIHYSGQKSQVSWAPNEMDVFRNVFSWDMGRFMGNISTRNMCFNFIHGFNFISKNGDLPAMFDCRRVTQTCPILKSFLGSQFFLGFHVTFTGCML